MSHKSSSAGVDRYQLILEVALNVFAEQGFEAATTKQIAQQVGVNQGLIYFYFKNKADLFFAAFGHYTQQILPQLSFLEEISSAEPFENGFYRLLTRILEILDTPLTIKLLRIMDQVQVQYSPEAPDHYDKLHTIGALAEHIMLGIWRHMDIQVKRRALVPIDTQLVAHLVTRLLISFILTRDNTYLGEVPRQKVAETIFRLTVYGLLPRDASGHLGSNDQVPLVSLPLP